PTLATTLFRPGAAHPGTDGAGAPRIHGTRLAQSERRHRGCPQERLSAGSGFAAVLRSRQTCAYRCPAPDRTVNATVANGYPTASAHWPAPFAVRGHCTDCRRSDRCQPAIRPHLISGLVWASAPV